MNAKRKRFHLPIRDFTRTSNPPALRTAPPGYSCDGRNELGACKARGCQIKMEGVTDGMWECQNTDPGKVPCRIFLQVPFIAWSGPRNAQA